MADFDPYYRWLGIPPEEQPAHHYRLLGLTLFESDRVVIETRSLDQIDRVRKLQLVEDPEVVSSVLGALALARSCLLDADQKAAYDTELYEELEASWGAATDENSHIQIADQPKTTGTATHSWWWSYHNLPRSLVRLVQRVRHGLFSVWESIHRLERNQLPVLRWVLTLGACVALALVLFVLTQKIAPTLLSQPPKLSDGLVAYYPFKGNARDESGSGNLAPVSKYDLATDRFTSRGSAYKPGRQPRRHRNQRIQLDVAGLPTGSSPRTVSLWTNQESDRAHGLLAWGIAKNGQAFTLMVHPDYGGTFVVSSWGRHYDIDSKVRADGNWHHLVGVYDGSLKIYVDGTLCTSAVRAINTVRTKVYLGAQVGGIQKSNGTLDDIRIYNRALSANEVKQLYAYERAAP